MKQTVYAASLCPFLNWLELSAGKQQLGSGSPVYPTLTEVKFSTDYLAIVHKMPTMSHLNTRETKIKKAVLTLVTLGGLTYRPIFKYTLLNYITAIYLYHQSKRKETWTFPLTTPITDMTAASPRRILRKKF